MRSFHENLRSIMNDKKLTAENIAEKMGVSTSTVTHWSNGRRFPKNEDFIKSLASILGVHTSDLFDDEIGVKYIPLIGVASCGVPNIAYSDDIEYIPVNPELARDGVYAVKAEGESMLPDIKDGDVIICDKNMECSNGDIVHYTTIDGDSGLKKYLVDDKGVVTLMPVNTNFQPIMCDVRDVKCARAFKKIGDL